MAESEDRGRRAGERFSEAMKQADPESARIFGQIALEERAHIALAERFFPEARGPAIASAPPVELGSTPWPEG
jgi:hypothetical protein